MMGCGHNLDIVLPAVSLCRMKSHARRACREASQVMTLCMSCFRKDEKGVGMVHAFGDDVEGFEIVFQTFAAFPSEAESGYQPYPVQESRK